MIDRKLDKLDYVLITCVIISVLIGVLTLFTQEVNISDGPGKWYKQLLYAGIGLVAMIFMTRINYQLLGSYAFPIYLFSIVLLVLTLIPGIGYLPSGRGARSWLKLGIFSIQTSEFAKLSTVILLGQYLVLKEREVKNISVLVIPFLIVLVPMVLITLQPDFGTAVSFIPILLAILFLGGADILHISSLIILGFISLAIPMYVEFTKLTLVDALKTQLGRMDKSDLLTLTNKLGGKIWLVIKGKTSIPGEGDINLTPKSINYLLEAADQVIDENTGIFFKFFINEDLMIGTGVILMLVSLILFIIKLARGKDEFRKFYIPLGVIGLSIVFAYIVTKTIPFRENQVVRLTAFINPDQFKQGAGYQLRASKPAIGSGRFLGKGLANGEMTEGRIPHVPESSTDFIFASWAEQTGFVGSVFLIFVLLAIPLRGLQVAFESKDKFGSLLAAGIVALIFFHMFINLGIVMGLLPVTGLPLSFVSYGGSHLIMSMMAVGIIISIKIRKHAN
ncbi:MAG: rod shape-determining protein RodA [Leptospiraceae bacterium]|nr:rod shape-determining protein RodA [Leptospiraceae bacterium]MCP5513160.1 rod shape-determining protein RodA [Leptospiraceae bacterium]